MTNERLTELLAAVQAGTVPLEQALQRLRSLPFEELGAPHGETRLDTHRELRTGLAEVVYCAGKTAEQVTQIMQRLVEHHGRALGTRATPELAAAVRKQIRHAHYDPVSRLLSVSGSSDQAAAGSELPETHRAAVVSGGTSDQPVAEEAAQTLEFLGHRVERIYDVGVAGLHRLLAQRSRLDDVAVVISVAGMEGALTSVVAGLIAAPVIGVPTSVGYGANFGGVAALLAMLNSCATGVAVVNIDNGFGAALVAHATLEQIRTAAASAAATAAAASPPLTPAAHDGDDGDGAT